MIEDLEDKVLLTDIEHKGKPFFALEGHRGFFVNLPYLFNSVIFTDYGKAVNFMNQLKQDSVLQKVGAEISHFNNVRKFHFVHVKAPAEIRDHLGDRFVTPHYTEQLRTFANPGTWVNVTSRSLLDSLELRDRFDDKIIDLEKEVENRFYKESDSHRTRMFNALKRLFINPKPTDEHFLSKQKVGDLISRRKLLHDEYLDIQNKISGKADLKFNENTNELELSFYSLPLIPTRQITAHELMKKKWMFFDTEVPMWESNNPQVTMNGSISVKEDELKKKIFVMYPFSKKEISGYDVISGAPTERAQSCAVTEYIREENVSVLSSFNIPFDMQKQFELDIDKDLSRGNSKPRQRSSSPMKRRFTVPGKTVIDLLPWARLMFSYLPRQKLEVVINHLHSRQGLPQIKKSQDYAELKAKHLRAVEGDESSTEGMISYLAQDVDWLHDIFKSKEFKESFEGITDLAAHYRLNPADIIADPLNINLIQDRSYLANVGTYRNEIFRRTPNSQEQNKKASIDFKKLLEKLVETEARKQGVFERSVGSFKNVTQAYIPYGYHLRKPIEVRFPDAKYLFEKKASGGGSFEDHLRFMYSKYANAFADYMIKTYMVTKSLSDHTLRESGILIPDQEKLKESFIRAGKSFGKFEGNYNQQISDVDIALEETAKRIVDFTKRSGLALRYQEGPFLYFTGETNGVFNKSPVVKTDEIPLMNIFVQGRNTWKMKYPRYGYVHGEKTKRKNTKDNSVSEDQLVLF